jgi:hypothetical protein
MIARAQGNRKVETIVEVAYKGRPAFDQMDN